MAIEKGRAKIIAGWNIERNGACITLINHCFITEIQGVLMQLETRTGYNHQQSLIIDDCH